MPTKKTTQEEKAFSVKLERIMDNLMRCTECRNLSQLGRWLKKKDDRNATMYFVQAKFNRYLDFGAVVDRCIEEGINLNEVFIGPDYKVKEQNEFQERYKTLESQLKELIRKNDELTAELKRVHESNNEITLRASELMLKYMSLMNRKE